MIYAILQTLLGGVIALAGVLIGPYFQRKHERWLAKRSDDDTKRAKAESLFDDLDRISSKSRQSTVSVMNVIQNEKMSILPAPDLGRVRAVASVYFPTCQVIIDEYEDKRKEKTKKIMQYLKKQTDAGEVSASEIRSIQVVMATEHQSDTQNFIDNMRAHISEVVPRLS